jgi:tRNA(fMet)-specific endonuclease VapC
MIADRSSILLDTGIVVLLCRGGEAAERLEARYALSLRRETPLLSVISVGELLAFARNASWGSGKEARLRALLSNFVIVDINREPVLNAYTDISAHVKRDGTPMGQQNDLWIAATARATGAILLTTDRDFDVLHPAWIQREYVDPMSLRS